MKEPSDYLSPILVKELRQGLRARAFTMSFLLLQGVMILVMTFGLLVAPSGRDEQLAFQTFFWAMIGLPIVIVLPLSGIGAVRTERTRGTLELMYLTRLSAFRIVAGKWWALTVQALLVACAVLPYVVLRYFLGGVELWQDLVALAVLMLSCAVFTACTVGFSAFSSKAPRWILIVVGLFLLQGLSGLPFFLAAMAFGGGPGPFSVPLGISLFLVALSAILILLTLQAGASRIAPPAENHTTRIRLLGLALLLAGAIAGRRQATIGVLVMLVLLPICVFGMCEQVRRVPSLYRPFTRRGAFGRLAGAFLYPGWPSGVVYALAAFAVYGFLFIQPSFSEEAALSIVSFVGAVFTPMAVLRLWLPRVRKVFTIYFLIEMIFSVPAYVYGVSRAASSLSGLSHGMELILGLFPTSVLLLSVSGALRLSTMGTFPLLLTTTVTLLGVIGLLIAAGRERAAICELERRSMETAPVPRKAD